MKIINYLSEKNIFIGGHYQFPSVPDDHSIESIQIINNLSKKYKSIISYMFIDDIGASTMCISKCGRRKAVQPIKSKEDDIVKKWIDESIEDLEESIIQNRDQYIIDKFKDLLVLLKTEIIIEKFNIREIIHNFEKIIYAYNKPKMRPLALSYILKEKLPKLILEKSINNRTSKQLHKLKKKQNKNLLIIQKNDIFKYQINNYIEEILLREETIRDGKMIKASNRCSGLLSTFFNKLVKDNLLNEQSLTIFYVIPEEDRYRLESGIISFITLYVEEYKIKYDLQEMTIITCIVQDTYLLNVYKYNLVEDIYSHAKQRVDKSE